jgi:ATP-dependent Lon protease
LFPEASLTTLVSVPATARAIETAQRTGGLLLAVQTRDQGRELQPVGTLAQLREQLTIDGGALRVELDGLERARVQSVIGLETQVAEVETLTDGDEGDDWGPAVEALARYLHAHPDLRSFMDQQRRAGGPMSWVNLACQHLPIAASARQKLLESSAAERCQKIARGLDALLRKEKGD